MTSAVVQNLAHARRERREVSLEGAPSLLADAYPISAAVCEALKETIGGWKVGHAPGGEPMAAPMYASGFLASGARFRLAPGRPMIPEIEIALRLARDLPPRPGKTYSRGEILDHASELLLGIELIERRIPPDGAPFALNLADDLGNIGYVTGPAVKDFHRLDLSGLHCRYWMGGESVTDRRGGHGKIDPMVPLIDWANSQCDRLGGMKAGHVITLGSLTPMRPVSAPMALTAELEGFGRVTADIV